ncbi:MAG: hypothetical protein J3K34DRAFT_135272 [Monoraphidium minutum]|nr:MAG: hypothetical protein J3K34DRAFT_135272 [Monoraphidium minutum]
MAAAATWIRPGGGPGALASLDEEGAPEAAPLILITTVDIGEGRSDRIEVRYGDEPLELAAAFVERHGLPPSIIDALAQHLHDNLADVAAAAAAAAAAVAEQSHEGRKSRSHSPPRSRALTSSVMSTRSEGGNSAVDDTDAVVFERLYEHAIVLRHKLEEKKRLQMQQQDEALLSGRAHMSWISQEMMRERTVGPYDNYGEMLYAESLEGAARRRQRAERDKAEREAQELTSATFQPEISRMAQIMWSRHDGGGMPAWQRLSKSGNKSKTAERLEMLRKEKEEAETRECTFRPAISKRSDKLMADRSDTLRSLNVSAHQQLYQDSLRRQQKQEQYASWYPEDVTFQPRLVSTQRGGGVGMLSGGVGGGGSAALVDRLYASYEKLQAKLAEARAKLDGPTDPATGRPLYRPQIGRAPAFTRHRPEQGVGEYLFSLQGEREEKARVRLEEEDRRAGEARKAKLAPSSIVFVRKLQRKRFEQVFSFLDKAGSGRVDLAALLQDPPACLEELDDDVREDVEVAARLACRPPSPRQAFRHQDSAASAASSFFMPPPPAVDMRQGALLGAKAWPGSAPPSPKPPVDPTRVTLDAFCGLMEDAIAARPRPRAYLAPSPPQKYTPAETFAPVISERSKMLAARLRPKDTPAHEILHREATHISAKKAALRAAAQDAALRECTFAPRLVSEQLVPKGRVMKVGGCAGQQAGPGAGRWHAAPGLGQGTRDV